MTEPPPPNPYQSPQWERPPARRRWRPRHLWAVAIGGWMLTVAARRFLPAFEHPAPVLAGALLAAVSIAVGRIIATQREPRLFVVGLCALSFLALTQGWVHHPGEERTMWAFTCISAGMLLGTIYPLARRGN